MIESLSDQKRKEAYEQVGKRKKRFDEMDIVDRLERIRQGDAKAKENRSLRARSRETKCPSCEGVALIVGDLIRSTTPKDQDGEFVQDDVWLPTGLVCFCCELVLRGHAYVSALGFGDQFTTKDILDPKDYYQIEFDPSDYYWDEYNNE